MSYHENDHFEGIYTFENEKDKPFPSTIAQLYRSKRKHFLIMLSNVRAEHKTIFINNHIDKEENELKEKDIYAKYENREIFNKGLTRFSDDPDLLKASYLEFLNILKDSYSEIDELNFTDTKWLKDVSTFHNFYQILTNYNIINSDYYRFHSFFLLKNEMIFNSNLYETSSICFHLIENNYISAITLDSFLNSSLIIARNGKTANRFDVLTKPSYTKNTNKIDNEFEPTKVSKDVKGAMLEFGITILDKN